MSKYNPTSLVDTNKIRDFYEHFVKKTGVTVGWTSMQSAIRVYATASNCSNQRWTEFQSVLDVGSGEGHLLNFLRKERGFTGFYTGLELLDLFYDRATELYGSKTNARFIQAEFLAYDFGEEQFDWVFSLGSLAVKQAQQREHDLAFCRKMIGLAKYGITIYLLNDVERMRPGWSEEITNLAFHNVPEFVQMLQAELPDSEIKVVRYPSEDSQNKIVHLTKRAE